MCLIIAKPVGQKINWEHVGQAALSNKDGYGMSIRRGEKVSIRKYLNFHMFEEACRPLAENPDTEVVIHLRYGTTGSATIENVHPFRTSQGYALHHNGVIKIPTYNNKTDSECFKEAHIDGKKGKFLFSEIGSKEIETILTASNKVLLHTPQGFHIYNESRGLWENGCWYSNDWYHKPIWGYQDSFTTTSTCGTIEPETLWEYLYEVLPNHNPVEKTRLLNAVEAYMLEGIYEEELYERVKGDY